MKKSFFSLVLAYAFCMLFLLFGSLRLQWATASNGGLDLNFGLKFRVPPASYHRTQQGPAQVSMWDEAVFSALLHSFGEPAALPPSTDNPSEVVGSIPLSRKGCPVAYRVTPDSVFNRLQGLIKIEPLQTELKP